MAGQGFFASLVSNVTWDNIRNNLIAFAPVIGVAISVVAIVNTRNIARRQETESHRASYKAKVRDYVERATKFANAYVDFAESLGSLGSSIQALNYRLQSIAKQALVLEVMTVELPTVDNTLRGRFTKLATDIQTMFQGFVPAIYEGRTLHGSQIRLSAPDDKRNELQSQIILAASDLIVAVELYSEKDTFGIAPHLHI